MGVPALRPLELSDLRRVHELVQPEIQELVLGEEDLRRNLFEDPDASQGLLLGALEGEALAGIACAVLRGQVGHIKLLAVERSRRRVGIGGRLLREVESRLASLGAASVQTDGAAPVYLLPGLPVRCAEGRRFFEARGYRELETRVSMTASLQRAVLETGDLEARLAHSGIQVRRAAAEDAELLRCQIGSIFSREWAVEVDFSLKRAVPGTHIALSGGRLAGFASARVWARNAFGPMGTIPGHEGKGIGEVLLKRGLADLLDAGEERAVIPWIGPEAFYRRKAGANTTLEYAVLQK